MIVQFSCYSNHSFKFKRVGYNFGAVTGLQKLAGNRSENLVFVRAQPKFGGATHKVNVGVSADFRTGRFLPQYSSLCCNILGLMLI